MEISSFAYHRGELPVLLELPHGIDLTPPEVKAYLQPKFTSGDKREDSDELSDELYLELRSNLPLLRFSLWRAYADRNRELDDLSDGAVKTHTPATDFKSINPMRERVNVVD